MAIKCMPQHQQHSMAPNNANCVAGQCSQDTHNNKAEDPMQELQKLKEEVTKLKLELRCKKEETEHLKSKNTAPH